MARSGGEKNMKSCFVCNYAIHYYRGKNKKPNCLKLARCQHPKIKKSPDSGKNGRWIATYRDSLWDKIKTHPRWCPFGKKDLKKTLDKITAL
jgi:hypothetical protein